MSLVEELQRTVQLMPESLVREVLDFALFLRQREEQAECQNLMRAQSQSLRNWDNDEDEVWNDVPPILVKTPNAATRAAMEEARSSSLPRFASAQELFDDLEKDGEE